MVGSEDLGVRHRNYGRVHPGARCPESLRRVRGPRMPSPTSGPGGSDAIETGAQRKSARLSLLGDEMTPARCERMVMARLWAPLGATNVLIEPNQRWGPDAPMQRRGTLRENRS